MHERALVTDLVRKASEIALAQGAARVVAMRVRVGPLSHVDAASLPGLVTDAARGTPVEGADVQVVTGSGSIDDPGAQDVVLETVSVEQVT